MKFEVSESMETEILCQSGDLGVDPNVFLDACLMFFFWHNSKALDKLFADAGKKVNCNEKR